MQPSGRLPNKLNTTGGWLCSLSTLRKNLVRLRSTLKAIWWTLLPTRERLPLLLRLI